MTRSEKYLQKYLPILSEKYGQSMAQQIMEDAAGRLREINAAHPDLTKQKQFHADGIFPRVAVYQAMQQVMPKEEAFTFLQDAMHKVAVEKGAQLAGLLQHAWLRSPFLLIFQKMTKKMFGESAGFELRFYEANGNRLRFDITRCPYHDLYAECGCVELNAISCESDEFVYGKLPGIVFERHETIGNGCARCDFCLYKCKKEKL